MSRNSSNTEAPTCRYLSSEILGVLNMACKICEQLRNTRIQIYFYRTILCLCAAAGPEIRVFAVPLQRHELFEFRSKAASVKNFAVHLTRMLFQPEELRGRNVRGVTGKQPLNPDKVKVIMDAVCKFYPAPPEGRDFQWRDCRKAVDTYLRGIKFSERNQ